MSAVKRALREGGYPKVKVGHGGTLDPLATGVLPIALGEATKLAGRMLDATKSYDFEITFGLATDTLDLEGQVMAESDVRPTREGTLSVLDQFRGAISQVPPAYSALKIDGKRSYDMARGGESVALPARNLIIHALTLWDETRTGHEVTQSASPLNAIARATFSATVSKGTYIRSLARDIAHVLGTVGHVSMLRRTKAGPFDLSQAISLDLLDEKAMRRALEDICLPMTAGLDDIPALSVTPDQAGLLRQGRVLAGIAATDGLTLAKDGETPVALVEVIAGHVRVVRGFNL